MSRDVLVILMFASSSLFMLSTGSALLLHRRAKRAERAGMSAGEIAAAHADRALFQAIQRETRYLINEIPEHMAIQNRMEHSYMPNPTAAARRRGKRKRVKISFEMVLLTRTEIWFRFNGRKLPAGVSFFDIKNPANHVLENLQHGIGRPCRFYEDAEFNLFLRVGLKNSLMGIPRLVEWGKVVEALPKSRQFAIVVGQNEYSKIIYKDVTRWPHALILGGTNNGKTNMLKQLLCTLISRNTPQQLQFCLIDLKRVELPDFATIPHTIHHVDRPVNVQPLMEYLEGEMERRLDMFTGVCTDIRGWNHQQPNKLSRIMLVIDELATITTDKKLKSKTTQSLLNLARLGRAVGIHLILCTQSVSKEVLTMDVLTNIEGRVCFGMANTSASTLAIGNGLAVGLQPQGRCVLLDGSEYKFLQAPLITDEEIAATLAAARGVDAPPDQQDDDGVALLKLALYNYAGQAKEKELFTATPLSYDKVRKLLRAYQYNFDTQEPVIDLDGKNYILLPARLKGGKGRGGGNRSRQLMAVNGELPTSWQHVERIQNTEQTDVSPTPPLGEDEEE